MPRELTIARTLPPEDIRPGMYITTLYVVYEFLRCSPGDAAWRPVTTISTRWLPFEHAGVPLRVVEVCLPFVLVESADGSHGTIDTRRHQLAALSEKFGKRAFKKLRRQKPASAAE